MTVSYFVRYEVEDSEAFLRHYREKHVPILARWPGMRRIVLHTQLDWQDPYSVNRGKAVLLAQMEFENEDAMRRALASPERTEARRDFERFPPLAGMVVHQAMISEEVFP